MPYALSCLTTVEKRAGVGKGVWGAIFLFFREALGISRCFCRGGEQIPFLHTLFNLFFIFRFKSCIFPSSVISTFPFVCGFFFFFFFAWHGLWASLFSLPFFFLSSSTFVRFGTELFFLALFIEGMFSIRRPGRISYY